MKIKEKEINGKVLKGLINETLEVKIPFQYKDIEGDRNYFVCSKEDGSCDLYDENGNLLISDEIGYRFLKVLKIQRDYLEKDLQTFRVSNIDVRVYNQEGEVGIVGCTVVEDKKNTINSVDTQIVYPFGKVVDIDLKEDGQTRLYKMVDGRILIGFWKHPVLGTVDPIYVVFEHHRMRIYDSPCVPVMLKGKLQKEKLSRFKLSEERKYGNVCNYIEEFFYSIMKNGKIKYGIKQVKLVATGMDFNHQFELVTEDFLKPQFSGLNHFLGDQMYILEKRVGNKKKVGFLGYSIHWNWNYSESSIWGDCTKKVQVKSAIEYDDIKFIRETGNTCSYDYNSQPKITHAIVAKGGKFGLLKVQYARVTGDYDILNGKYKKDFGTIEEIAPCIYDSIDSLSDRIFEGRIGDMKRIFTDYKDREGKLISLESDYVAINKVGESSFIGILQNGEKEFINFIRHQDEKLGEYAELFVTHPYPNMDSNYCQNKAFFVEAYHHSDTLSPLDLYNDKGLVYENVLDMGKCFGYHQVDRMEDNCKKVSFLNDSGALVWELEGDNLSVKAEESLGLLRIEVGRDENRRIFFQKFPNTRYPSFSNYFLNKNYSFIYVQSIKEEALFAYYGEINEKNQVVTRYIRKPEDSDTFETLLEGNFSLKEIVCNGKRSIISLFDPESKKEKYGVIENKKGNICISYDFDNIRFDSSRKVFVATKNETNYVYDEDGFDLLQFPKQYELL